MNLRLHVEDIRRHVVEGARLLSRFVTLASGPVAPKLVAADVTALLLYGSTVGARMIATHSWPPSNNVSVASFVIAELFLAALASLLFASGLIRRIRERTRAHGLGSDSAASNGVVALFVISAMILVAFVGYHVLPTLSQRLHLGRHGLWPPIRLTSLRPVMTATGMRFPKEAVLLDGEFIKGGFQPFIMAKVRLPAGSVRRFLKQRYPPFSLEQTLRGEEARRALAAMRDRGSMQRMKERGWRPDRARRVVFAYGRGDPRREAECWVVIDLDDPASAVLYIFWAPI